MQRLVCTHFFFLVIWDDYFVPNNLTEDEHYFKYDFVRSIEETVGIDQSYDYDRQIEEYYFQPYMMGSYKEMAYGILDVSLNAQLSV